MPVVGPPSRRNIIKTIGAGVAAAATCGATAKAIAQAANPNLPTYKPALDQQFKLFEEATVSAVAKVTV